MARTYTLFITTILLVNGSSSRKTDTESRVLKSGIPTLIVPPTAPTRHQLIWGVGIPLDLNYESLVFGLVFKAQYYLADSYNKLLPSNFPGLGINGLRRKRHIRWDEESQMTVENFTVEVNVVEEDRLNNEQVLLDNIRTESDEEGSEGRDLSRWDIYNGLESIAKQYSFGERECVLRAICEAAETPFSLQLGLFEELVHIIMTPSSTPDQLSKHKDNEYFYAENIGRSNGNCKLVFPKCKSSLLDIFTGIHDPLLFNMFNTIKNREIVM